MILIAFGTRPEYNKIYPILKTIKGEYKTLFTGQHEDIIETFLPDIKIKIKNNDNRLDSIVKSILGNDRIFKGITHVMVQGDTTSAFAVALSAYHRKIPIIHLEAGLRTYDMNNPYPEELNRVAIDRMSDILLCPTLLNKNNLKKEGITKNVYITGNTGLDNLKNIDTSYTNAVLCTMHRRENHILIKEWFSTLSKLSNQHPNFKFIIPIHPNPNIQAGINKLGKKIDIRHPMSHKETINILKNCRFVITDSGGIQEEASFLKKRTFICRKLTERTECIGKSSVLCKTPLELLKNFKKYINNYIITEESPYGNGRASEKIAKILSQWIKI